MHKIYLLITIVMFTAFSYADAQVSKGSLWLGGSMNYGTSSSEVEQTPDSKQKSSALTFAPYVGRAVRENSIVGISLNYRLSTAKSTLVKSAATDYGAGLFYRKYKALGKGFYFFLNGEVGYLYGLRKDETINNPESHQTNRLHTVSISGYPGIAYAVSPNIHLEARMGDLISVYFTDQHAKSYSTNNISDYWGRSVQVSSSLNQLFNYWGIGFRFLLNGKRA